MVSMRSQSGFSLVELSIVLVILGLLVGGVLSGQALIRAAELKKIITSIDKVRTVHRVFLDKYLQRPGDMNNATAFWGTLASCPNEVAGNGTATCDGDGNGSIDIDNEPTRSWQHLANGGLVSGAYSGRYEGSNNLKAGSDRSNFFVLWGNSGLHVIHREFSGSAGGFPLPAAHYIYVGTVGSSGDLTAPITSVTETWNIDLKIDDGSARSGAMFIRQKYDWYNSGGWPSCINITDDDYNFEIGDALVIGGGRGPGCAFLVNLD